MRGVRGVRGVRGGRGGAAVAERDSSSLNVI